MMRRVPLTMMLTLLAAVFLVACQRGGEQGSSSELKQIQQQPAGEYLVTALNEAGQLKNGSNRFILEVRRASDQQPVDVGTVQASVTMPMPGMAPMIAETSITPAGTPGHYAVSTNFSMNGTWNLAVTFGNGQQTQLSLPVQ